MQLAVRLFSFSSRKRPQTKPPPTSVQHQANTEMDSSGPSNWSGLPSDVLNKIVNRLDTRTDVLYVRAVCYSWRSSVPLPPKNLSPAGSPPLQLPFPIAPNEYLHPRRKGYFLLKDTTVYCLEPLKMAASASCSSTSTNCWIVRIEDADHDSGKVRLKDPFSRFTIKKLGKIARLPNRVINLLDYRVREVGKSHCLEFVELGKIDASESDFNELKSINIRKVVVGLKNEMEFWVMAVHTGGKLGIWKKGNKKWAKVDDGRERSHYEDIAFHNGKFYAVDYTGLIIAVDPSFLQVTEVTPEVFRYGSYGYRCGDSSKYLVNSLGELFLIDKYVDCGGSSKYSVNSLGQIDNYIDLDSEDYDSEDRTPCFRIYKFVEERGEWIFVDDLGDQAMFVGDGCCYSVSAKDCAGLKKNCIYFSDDCFTNDINDDFPGCDAGLFDLGEDDAEPLKSAVGYSKIFWPPPTWLGKKPN